MEVDCRFIATAPFRFFLLLLSDGLLLHQHPVVGSRVSFINHGYRDIVVAISPNVPQDQASTLLRQIQVLVTDASSALYIATRKRAFIESVNILIPQTWDSVTANASTWENFYDAEIQIDLPNWRYGNQPYTVQLGGCGDPGQHIHMTPNYVMTVNSQDNTIKYGPAGKVFVREWARLRYGVFEEHGYTGEVISFPMFYQSSASSGQNNAPLLPNVCSAAEVGDFGIDYGCHIDPQTGLYNSDCTYTLMDRFTPSSSIMSDIRILSSGAHFCDDDPGSFHRHNREAPNKHNAMCGSRSVWSVILEHKDFADNKRSPTHISNTKPTFNIVRSLTGARFVLVADVSLSMEEHNRIGRLHQSVRRWIKYDIAEGTSLAIVSFSSKSYLLSNLTVVNDSTRQKLMNTVPSKGIKGTCIGCGLQTALDILKDEKGGVIILLTDGAENKSPMIHDVYPDLIAAQVQIVSVAFGDDAEKKIENLATETNGRSFFIHDNGNSDDLNDAFRGSLTYQPAVPSENLTVVLFQKLYRGQIDDSVSVDSTVGRELTFRVEYTKDAYLQEFIVTSPTGQVYDEVVFDENTHLEYITIPDIGEEGEWHFNLVVTSTSDDYVNVIVTSKPKSRDVAPITVECSILNGMVVEDASLKPVLLVAVVKQGQNRVIGANVRAYVEKPDAATEIVDLLDNGAGADANKDDGVYSRYYPTVNVEGRYSFICVVNSTESTYVDDGSNHQQRVKRSSKYHGIVNRVQSGGSFRVEKALPQNTDVYPPSRVTDLKVVAMQVDQMILTIEWTAPGDDLDTGKASFYQIKYSPVFDYLMDDNFTSELLVEFKPEDVIRGTLTPQEAGSKQIVSLSMPTASHNVTYFIALRAIDKANQTSNTSNIVSVQITSIEMQPTLPPTTASLSRGNCISFTYNAFYFALIEALLIMAGFL